MRYLHDLNEELHLLPVQVKFPELVQAVKLEHQPWKVDITAFKMLA